jgi:hypothetical protein
MSDPIDRAEWTWAVIVATLGVFVSTIPYLVGWLVQSPEMRFTGAVFNQEDYNSYLGKMWQGYRGAWRYQSLFTSEPHQGAYLLTFYIALGHLARHPRLFRSRQETAAAQWLAENTAWDDVIFARHRVVPGHWGETIDFAAKAQAVKDFYAGRAPVEKQRALLNRWRVRYVYLDETKPPYNTSDVLQGLALQKVFAQGPIYMYEVDP